MNFVVFISRFVMLLGSYIQGLFFCDKGAGGGVPPMGCLGDRGNI